MKTFKQNFFCNMQFIKFVISLFYDNYTDYVYLLSMNKSKQLLKFAIYSK